MKRHRVLSYDIDTRASLLSLKIEDTWEPDVQELHRQNQDNIRRGLLAEFGERNAEAKIQNFIDLENSPFSIVAYHNKFLRQIRYAFVIGSYYAALTGACALGERILNHLLLNLRESYKSTPEYKLIYRKSSFANWYLAITTLHAWGVLLPEAVRAYEQLLIIRNRTIHFDPATDHNDRELALRAITTLAKIIDTQFTAFGVRPWFIKGTPGVSFIKKEAESNPFVKAVYLPNCVLVGPHHTLESQLTAAGVTWIVHDEEYEQKEISDEEFAALVRDKN